LFERRILTISLTPGPRFSVEGDDCGCSYCSGGCSNCTATCRGEATTKLGFVVPGDDSLRVVLDAEAVRKFLQEGELSK
jgi:hypothetical protein